MSTTFPSQVWAAVNSPQRDLAAEQQHLHYRANLQEMATKLQKEITKSHDTQQGKTRLERSVQDLKKELVVEREKVRNLSKSSRMMEDQIVRGDGRLHEYWGTVRKLADLFGQVMNKEEFDVSKLLCEREELGYERTGLQENLAIRTSEVKDLNHELVRLGEESKLLQENCERSRRAFDQLSSDYTLKHQQWEKYTEQLKSMLAAKEAENARLRAHHFHDEDLVGPVPQKRTLERNSK